MLGLDSEFDPSCLARPPFWWLHASFRSALAGFSHWPAPEAYDDLAARVPRPPDVSFPRFVTESREAIRRLGGYERHVAKLAAVPTRLGSWHDFFNMAVWAHFPALRWALNGLHVDPGPEPRDPRNGRARSQNLATSFDETGMIVVSESRGLLEGMRALQLKRVFWQERAELKATTRFFIVGHGLLESLLHPHPGLIARSLFVWVPNLTELTEERLRTRCDARVAARIAEWRFEHTVFDPVPVCAIPGFADNDDQDFYDDRRRLPFEPMSRRPLQPGDFLE